MKLIEDLFSNVKSGEIHLDDTKLAYDEKYFYKYYDSKYFSPAYVLNNSKDTLTVYSRGDDYLDVYINCTLLEKEILNKLPRIEKVVLYDPYQSSRLGIIHLDDLSRPIEFISDSIMTVGFNFGSIKRHTFNAKENIYIANPHYIYNCDLNAYLIKIQSCINNKNSLVDIDLSKTLKNCNISCERMQIDVRAEDKHTVENIKKFYKNADKKKINSLLPVKWTQFPSQIMINYFENKYSTHNSYVVLSKNSNIVYNYLKDVRERSGWDVTYITPKCTKDGIWVANIYPK